VTPAEAQLECDLMAASPVWFTQTEAARHLGKSYRWVHRRVLAGTIPHTVLDGVPHIQAADLAAWVTKEYRPARYSRQRTPIGVAG
jgi:hypothetical protein